MESIELLPWLRFLHVAGAFLFAAGHGVSVIVAFKIRGERDPGRLGPMLDLSGASLNTAIVGLLVLLVTGIVAGIVGGSFGRGWIWLSLGLLVAIGVTMTPLGAGHFNRIRTAIGSGGSAASAETVASDAAASALAPTPGEPVAADPPPSVTADELERLLANRRPELLAAIGGGGFLVILWLMMFKPF